MNLVLVAAARIVLLNWESAKPEKDGTPFRGPHGPARRVESIVPLDGNRPARIARTIPIPGASGPSTMVRDDRAFRTTIADEGALCRVLTLDRETGRDVRPCRSGRYRGQLARCGPARLPSSR